MRENRTYGSEGGAELIIRSLPLSKEFLTGVSIAVAEMRFVAEVVKTFGCWCCRNS